MGKKWKIACQKGLGMHLLQAAMSILEFLVDVLTNQAPGNIEGKILS